MKKRTGTTRTVTQQLVLASTRCIDNSESDSWRKSASKKHREMMFSEITDEIVKRSINKEVSYRQNSLYYIYGEVNAKIVKC